MWYRTDTEAFLRSSSSWEDRRSFSAWKTLSDKLTFNYMDKWKYLWWKWDKIAGRERKMELTEADQLTDQLHQVY